MVIAANNYAFISYSHADAKVARRLQQQLEQYVIPDPVFNQIDPINLPPDGSKNLRPIFLDESDLNGGLLRDMLRANLDSARYLIVICSPNSAKSTWVSEEVEFFIKNFRLQQIIPLVIDGTPFVDLQIEKGKTPEGEECMPASLVEYTNAHKEHELHAIDLREDGKEKALIKIISRMLGVNFDILWNRRDRERRLLMGKVIVVAIIAVILGGFYLMPLQLTYTVTYPYDGNTLVLPDDAVLTIEGTEFFLGNKLDTTVRLKNRPGYYRGRKLPVMFTATFFDTIHTVFDLGYRFKKNDIMYLRRDNTFGVFAGKVIDQEGNPIYGAKVAVKQNEVRTDENGQFRLLIPPGEQSEEQAIVIERSGYYDVYRPDECPSEDLIYIMYELE